MTQHSSLQLTRASYARSTYQSVCPFPLHRITISYGCFSTRNTRAIHDQFIGQCETICPGRFNTALTPFRGAPCHIAAAQHNHHMILDMSTTTRTVPEVGPPIAVHQLTFRDYAEYESFLLALDPQTRHDRFNGAIGDEAVRRYARQTFRRGAH